VLSPKSGAGRVIAQSLSTQHFLKNNAAQGKLSSDLSVQNQPHTASKRKLSMKMSQPQLQTSMPSQELL